MTAVDAPARRRWALDLGGASALPLLVLFGLNLVDELDRVAFAALSPEIRDAFDLGDAQIVAIGALSALLILFGALPLGYLGDRYPRTRIAGIAALVWSAGAVLTGLAWMVPVLFLARTGSGAARTSNEVVHPSLLADYYQPEVLPRVFRLHRMASPIGYGAALVVGVIAAAVGWRLAFVFCALPTLVLLPLLRRLPEPRRGGSLALAVADDEAEPAALSFAEARRSLFGVRTLRRCWLGGFLLGIAFIANAQLLSLFFEDVHGFGPFGRGFVQFVYGAGTVAGIVAGGSAAGRSTASGRFHALTYVIAGSFFLSALALVGMAAAPWAAASVAMVFVLGIGLGVYQPAYFPLVARIVHPRIKTQAYGWTLLFAGLGGLGAIPLARYGEHQSYRLAFLILAALIALGAAVVASSAGCVADDMARADAA
ncbi:MAG: ABC-type branched-chain amino acid transport system, ATPase component [Actinomycetia bacterium]|nr:ABC-type branched-chain amino acid transport system, ATPase component [Actinomycetes bacterium]